MLVSCQIESENEQEQLLSFREMRITLVAALASSMFRTCHSLGVAGITYLELKSWPVRIAVFCVRL